MIILANHRPANFWKSKCSMAHLETTAWQYLRCPVAFLRRIGRIFSNIEQEIVRSQCPRNFEGHTGPRTRINSKISGPASQLQVSTAGTYVICTNYCQSSRTCKCLICQPPPPPPPNLVPNLEIWVPRGMTSLRQAVGNDMKKNIHYSWFSHFTWTKTYWCWKYSLSLYFFKKQLFNQSVLNHWLAIETVFKIVGSW